MTAELTIASQALGKVRAEAPLRLPPVPWRDAYTVSPEALGGYIRQLETACALEPKSADLRTCLGMAYAMNYEVYKSMDALELATQLEPEHFFAQLKFAELQYRLRALISAERETLKAVDLAGNCFELSLARKQLAEIRRLMREGTQKPEFTKPLGLPTLAFVVMTILLCLVVNFR